MTGTTSLTVTRWRRYGKDRLYVSDPSGARVGWVDLVSGQRQLEQEHQADAFGAAVTTYLEGANAHDEPVPATGPADASATGSAMPAEAPGPERAVDSVPQWADLSCRRPGQAAREKALEELAASRERSRFWSFVARAVDAKTDERAWRVGADGEEAVGGRLEKLRRHGWHVLHAVPVGERGSDIDHVLLGPGGVYTINTKNHPGGRVWVGKNSVRVNGHSVPYLRNSRHEAARASRLLSAAAGFDVPVRPVLVFLTGSLIPNVTVKTHPDDVLILDRMDIPGAFKRAPLRMDPMVVETVCDVARRSTTWSSTGR